MYTQKHQLLKKLSEEIGKQIPLIEGAAVLTLQNDKIYLEFPEQSPVYVMHMEICSLTSLGANVQVLEKLLHLNSRLDVLHCGWLGFHKTTNTLRYFVTVPAQIATATLLLEAINAMAPVKKHVTGMLNI